MISAKRKLYAQENTTGRVVPEPSRQRWYFGGKILGDKSKIGDINIQQGFVIQCLVNNLHFNVVHTKD